jgi:GMP synthase-like glutamine amidotransferase
VKPVLVLQHIDRGGPGLFAEFLEEQGIPWALRRPDRGDPLPRDLDAYSGLCLCGGTQSVNDRDAWIREEIGLTREAARQGRPVIGHCLGGQIISRALGGEVTRSPAEEFGWQPLRRSRSAAAAHWLGGLSSSLTAMQWHNECFSLPPGAEPLLEGDVCPLQAFAAGPLLAMQFHVELTEELIRHWAVDLAHLAPPPGRGVQTPDAVLEELPANFPVSRALARQLYARWIEAL